MPQIGDMNTGQPHVNETEPAEQQLLTSAFPNQMIEQINIALEQKGRISQPGSLRSLPSETNVRKSIYIN